MQVQGDMRGCFYFFISIPIMIFMYGYGVITSKVEPWIVRRAMSRKGRMLNKSDLKRLESSEGTLIYKVETLTRRLWWTEDNILAITPVEYPSEECRSASIDFDCVNEARKICKRFDYWMYNTYTNLQSGKAKLIRIDADETWGAELRSSYPSINSVETHFIFPGIDEVD